MSAYNYATRVGETGAETDAEMQASKIEAADMLARWFANGWTHVSCGCCNGLEWGGEEPRECRDCGGGGMLWKSPKGRLALYPGGPFTGRTS